jgi:hypothetical protein
MMSRSRVASILGGVLFVASSLTSSALHADESAPVVATVHGGDIRVQISEGLTRPCDSRDNRMLFDGRLKSGESFRGAIGGDCVCVRHTSSRFPRVDWSESGLVCRPRICHGKICRPAPDPTIYLSLP